jgi:hypothetical protein
VLEAQAAIDDWVREYNAQRPHQALDVAAPVTPERELLDGFDECGRSVNGRPVGAENEEEETS